MARKELRASAEVTRECVTRMLRKKVKTMRSEEDGIYVEGFLPFSLMEEVVELLKTAKKFQRITDVDIRLVPIPFEPDKGPDYWKDKYRRLKERMQEMINDKEE